MMRPQLLDCVLKCLLHDLHTTQREREQLLKNLLLIEGGHNILDVEQLERPLGEAVKLHDAQTGFDGASLDAVPMELRERAPVDLLSEPQLTSLAAGQSKAATILAMPSNNPPPSGRMSFAGTSTDDVCNCRRVEVWRRSECARRRRSASAADGFVDACQTRCSGAAACGAAAETGFLGGSRAQGAMCVVVMTLCDAFRQ
jgi:hypothetical protein